MSKPWYKLNIDISNAIRSDFDFDMLVSNSENQNTKTSLMWVLPQNKLTDLVTAEWLEYMKSINLEVLNALIFYRIPNLTDLGPHVDVGDMNEIPNDIAINWVIGLDKSYMVWHEIINSKNAEHRITAINSKYIRYPAADVKEVDRHIIGNLPTLVRVDIPHNIETGDIPRLSISIRINIPKIFADKRPSWEEIVKHFEKFIYE